MSNSEEERIGNVPVARVFREQQSVMPRKKELGVYLWLEPELVARE